jgi:hypothetical protein
MFAITDQANHQPRHRRYDAEQKKMRGGLFDGRRKRQRRKDTEDKQERQQEASRARNPGNQNVL